MKKWLLGLLIFFLGLVIFFPYIGSSSLGKPFVLLLLQNPIHGSLSVKKVRLSWFGPQVFERSVLKSSEYIIKCDTVSAYIPLWQIKNWQRHIQIQNGSFSSLQYEQGELVDVQAIIQDGKIELTALTPQKGSLSIQGTLPAQKKPFNLAIKLRNIPTIVLDGLLQCNTWLTKTLGSLSNINAVYTSEKEKETLSIDLTSIQVKSSLRAEISDHVMTLTAPWISTLSMSDSLRSALLEKMQSQWITDFQPKNPIILQIFPENFRCSLFPFQFNKLQIGNGSLNLGKVLIQSDPSTRFLMKLLKGQGIANPILFWFTSLPFHLENKMLSLGRVDALLSQSIHLCTWGEVNLSTEKLHMFLGIPIATLQNILDISIFPSNYVFKIPITGSLTRPKFNTGPAFGKIATMAASKQIPTMPGKIFGGLVNTIVQAQDQNDVPEPQRPFPWER